MPVVFKGGTSGNRTDGIANMPSAGVPQPVIDTSNKTTNPNLHLQAEKFRPNEPQTATPDFMPTGVELYPTDLSRNVGSDQCQQDIVSMGPDTKDATVWAGAKNTGVGGERA